MGTCPTEDGGHTRSGYWNYDGLPSSMFGNFKKMTICFRRDSILNYHSLAKMRSETEICECGSKNDSNLRFCLKNQQNCPPNNFDTGQTGSKINSDYYKEF